MKSNEHSALNGRILSDIVVAYHTTPGVVLTVAVPVAELVVIVDAPAVRRAGGRHPAAGIHPGAHGGEGEPARPALSWTIGRTRVTGHDCGNQSSARTQTAPVWYANDGADIA